VCPGRKKGGKKEGIKDTKVDLERRKQQH